MKIEIPLPYHLSGHSFYLCYLQRFVLGPVSKCVCACMFHVWEDLRVKKEDGATGVQKFSTKCGCQDLNLSSP